MSMRQFFAQLCAVVLHNIWQEICKILLIFKYEEQYKKKLFKAKAAFIQKVETVISVVDYFICILYCTAYDYNTW